MAETAQSEEGARGVKIIWVRLIINELLRNVRFIETYSEKGTIFLNNCKSFPQSSLLNIELKLLN